MPVLSSCLKPQIFTFRNEASCAMDRLKMAATKTKRLRCCLSEQWGTQPLKSALPGGQEDPLGFTI